MTDTSDTILFGTRPNDPLSLPTSETPFVGESPVTLGTEEPPTLLVANGERYGSNITTQIGEHLVESGTSIDQYISTLIFIEGSITFVTLSNPNFAYEIQENGSVKLYYRGSALDYESLSNTTISSSMNLSLTLDGTTTTYTYNVDMIVTDVNEQPTALTATKTVAAIDEGYYENGLKVADIVFTDDAIGYNAPLPFPPAVDYPDGAPLPDIPETPFEYRNITRTTAELWLKDGTELQFTSTRSLSVEIQSNSTGNGERPAPVTLHFNINDVNLSPEFVDGNTKPVSGYTFTVEDDATSTFVIGTVSAVDQDPNEQPSSISMQRSEGFSFDPATLFRINPSSGALTLIRDNTLDFSVARSYTFDVVVSGTGPEGHTIVKAPVTINVLPTVIVATAGDINIGTQEHPGVVQNTAEVGDLVGVVNATGPIGKQLEYGLTKSDGTASRYYQINSSTGEITLKAAYPRDIGSDIHTLTVTVSAAGETSVSVPVSVAINTVTPPPALNKSIIEGQKVVVKFDDIPDDADGDTFATFVPSLTNTPTSTLNGSYIVTESGDLIWTPNQHFTGVASFTADVEDSRGGVTSQQIRITVTAIELVTTGVLTATGSTVAFEDNRDRNPEGQIRITDTTKTGYVLYVGNKSNQSDPYTAVTADRTVIVLEYGTLTIDRNGRWTYELDNANRVVNDLDGDSDDSDGALGTLVESLDFQYRYSDLPHTNVDESSTLQHVVNITINGSTDLTGLDVSNFDDITRIATPNSDNLYGGRGNDVLIGSPFANVIKGNAGDDWLYGHGGNDTFYVQIGNGNDVIDGGSGTDTLVFNPDPSTTDVGAIQLNLNDNIKWKYDGSSDTWVPGSYRISDYEYTRLWIDSNKNGRKDTGDEYHYLKNVENLHFTGGAGNDVVLGGSGNDIFTGNGGVDIFTGRGGNDYFDINQLAASGDRIEVTDFTRGDKIRIAPDVEFPIDDLNLVQFQALTGIRWTQNTEFNSYGSSGRDPSNSWWTRDTIIYDTKGTQSHRDDTVFMVLQDFTGTLDVSDFILLDPLV
jgi:VCBS repeat-containing protein